MSLSLPLALHLPLFSSVSGPAAQAEALKEENDSLRCQLDAYRNEVELLKQEQGKAQPPRSEEDTTRQQQLSFLQQALQGMQKVPLPRTHAHTHAYTHMNARTHVHAPPHTHTHTHIHTRTHTHTHTHTDTQNMHNN